MTQAASTSKYSLDVLLDDCYTERPKPSTLKRSAVFEGSAPKLSAIALVPSESKLAPVDAQISVVGNIAVGNISVVDLVSKLNDGQRH